MQFNNHFQCNWVLPKKTGINRKRPLFVALPTEKVKDVDKNSCWNNQATEHGNNSDKNTRGSLFFISIALVELSHFVSNGISLSMHLVFAFTKKHCIGLPNSPTLSANCRCPFWNIMKRWPWWMLSTSTFPCRRSCQSRWPCGHTWPVSQQPSSWE